MPSRASRTSSSSPGMTSCGRVLEIRQQGEVQVVVAVGQVPHFEPFQQVRDGLGVREHRRHDDHRAMLGRDAVAEIHAAAAAAAAPAASPAS